MNIIRLVLKDVRIFSKSKSLIVITYLVPMFLALIFGAIFGGFGEGGGQKGIRLLITDNDKSEFSRSFAAELDSLEEIRLYRYYVQDEEKV